jgi:hypothetical protein
MEGGISGVETGGTYRALCAASTSLRQVRAHLWALEGVFAALRSPAAGAELPALVEELRANRRASMAALLDAQQLVQQVLDAASSPMPSRSTSTS